MVISDLRPFKKVFHKVKNMCTVISGLACLCHTYTVTFSPPTSALPYDFHQLTRTRPHRAIY
jgi:hypothetical protein